MTRDRDTGRQRHSETERDDGQRERHSQRETRVRQRDEGVVAVLY